MLQRTTCSVLFATLVSLGAAAETGRHATGKDLEYLGQMPPGSTPELFAPGIVSTEKNELNLAVSPDGSEIFFTEWSDGKNTLFFIRKVAGEWAGRSVAEFSGESSDVDPYFSADGRRLYFSSMRPTSNTDSTSDSNLWFVEKTAAGGWGPPQLLQKVNDPASDEYYTSQSSDGELYFSIFASHGSTGDVYRSPQIDGTPSVPELLPPPISTDANEHDPLIAPDGSYLVFTSNRPGGFGRGDLYIAFRDGAGWWSEPLNMGPTINTAGYEFCPMLSPDGKYLFFTRNDAGQGDIYWVDSAVIEALRTAPPEKTR
jgi:hypothetical protein